MPTITTAVGSVNISSTFTVSGGKMSTPTTGKASRSVLVALPDGARVTSAYVQLKAEGGVYGGTLRLNDALFPYGTSQTPVTVTGNAVDLVFTYKTLGSATATEGSHISTVKITQIELVCEYEAGVDKCGAPTSGSLAKTEATSADEYVRINWSGATPGAGGTITGYSVQYAQSTDGGRTWPEWSGLTTVTHEYHDTRPGPEGTWRRYRVRANSSAGDAYHSDWYNIPGTLHLAGEYDDGTQPHTNMPPYRAVNMWRRKA